MSWGKRVISILMLCTAVSAAAQTTRVKGRVTDEATGEGLPFVGIFFEGTAIGVSTDLEGYYILETRDPAATVLTAQLIGYHPQTLRIRPGSFAEVNFRLRLDADQLQAAVVRPDDRYMKSILRRIDEHRDRNDPEKRDAYACDIYTKMELDLTNPDRQALTRALMDRFDFVYDYLDTSVVSGHPYLPVMISETTARRYHRNSPALDREDIEASRISGVNPDNSIQQFTGSMHLKVNFYHAFINSFNVEIPSPLAPSGHLYYNYYLIDSLAMEGRKTYLIRYHPKRYVSTPCFDGEMYIDAGDFGLRKIHAKLQKGANVNWIRDLVLDQENRRTADSLWFYKEDRMYADFSVTMRDSSRIASFIGRRQVHFSEPETVVPDDLPSGRDNVTVRSDAGHRDEAWWAAARPFALTDKERRIYDMVDAIQDTRFYRDIYRTLNMIAVGYFDMEHVGLGPYSQLISFNNTEGVRLRLGIRTTKPLSKRWRLSAFAAYGTKDHAWKGGGTLEYMFGTEPWRKLTVSARHEVVQLGSGQGIFYNTGQNIFTSLFADRKKQKFSPLTEYSATYVHEWRAGLINTFAVEVQRYHANAFVPLRRPDGTEVPSVAGNQLHYTARLTWDEHVTRGVFELGHIYTKYPVLALDLMGGLGGLTPDDCTYLRAELTADYELRLPPVGVATFHFNGGRIIGQVPYPLLKIHEGNGTWFYDRTAFSCMDYYEFASDTWATLSYEHNFNGFFLGRIPLLKELQLREMLTVKTAWGILSEDNGTRAPILFPAGMKALETPYVEVGAGVSNILRVFRVDAFWRLTHRGPDTRDFAVNFGVELQF